MSDGAGVLAEGVFRILEQVNEIDLKAYTEKSMYRRLIALLEDKGVDCSPVKEGFATVLNAEDFAQVYDFTDLLKSLKALLSNDAWRKSGKDITGFFCMVEPEANAANSLVEHELHSTLMRGNLYTSKGVTIQLDSIHNVKGETHTALLLLDTYYNRVHFVDILLRKLISKRKSITAAQKQRVRQGFVAFTRPTHLLVVAASKKLLGEEESEIESSIRQLQEQGWVIDDSLCHAN